MKDLLQGHDLRTAATFLISPQGKIIDVNESAGKILGLSVDLLKESSAEKVFPVLSGVIKKTFTSGCLTFNREIEWGEGRLIVDMFPLFLEGEKRAVLAIIRKKQDEKSRRLKIIKDSLTSILDTFTDGTWFCDPEGTVLWLSLAAKQTNLLTDEQALGRNMAQLLDWPKTEPPLVTQVQRDLAHKRIILHAKSGKQIMVTGYPIFDSQGMLALIVVSERDLTELNRLRRELEESCSLAQEYRSEISQLLSEQAELSDLVVRSPSMHRIIRTALKVARADSTVVIQGESGVGKSLLASLIHRNSLQKDGSFIHVDCGAIPETLIESELFGYEPGAFTGARVKGKPGLFELADEGTLFLDEVGDLPLNMQMKLLRFVETNELLRVGGTKARKVKTRVVAATHRNLSQMVKNGRFRQDLFFRLHVVPLQIPPLRERLEDIPPIAQKILDKFNQGKEIVKRISPEVLDRLMMYNFPGNVRELINLMERMIVMSEGEVITVSDLPSQIRGAIPERLSEGTKISDGDFRLKAVVEEFEARIISRVLGNHKNMTEAARAMGLNPSTLWRKIQRLGINQNNE